MGLKDAVGSVAKRDNSRYAYGFADRASAGSGAAAASVVAVAVFSCLSRSSNPHSALRSAAPSPSSWAYCASSSLIAC